MKNLMSRIFTAIVMISMVTIPLIQGSQPAKTNRARSAAVSNRSRYAARSSRSRTPVRRTQNRRTAGPVRRQAVPATPQNVVTRAKANDQKADTLKAEIDATRAALQKAPDKDKAELQALLDKQQKESISFLDRTKSAFFGVGKIAEQNREKAQLRKPILERKLKEEQLRFAKLTDKRDKEISLARQKRLHNKIHLEKIALGQAWSPKQKALVATLAVAGVAGAAHYMGATSAVGGYVAPYAQRLKQWWTGTPSVPSVPTEPSDAELMRAYMSPEEREAYAMSPEGEDMFISGTAEREHPVVQEQPGWFSGLWSKMPSRPSWLGGASQIPASLPNPASKGWINWIRQQGTNIIISKVQGAAVTSAMALGAGFINKAGIWTTADGKVVKNEDGSNFTTVDQALVAKKPAPVSAPQVPKPTPTSAPKPPVKRTPTKRP